jgi:predicted transcriptional regulator
VVRRGAGELETEVLGVLWAAGAAVTPAQLVAALGGELAYNTVHTILTRLQDKGLVVRVVDGGRRGYAPVKDAAEVAAERMRTVLESGADHAEILQRFVSSLSRDDERSLRAVLGDGGPAPGAPS